jgi:hypothetical protein
VLSPSSETVAAATTDGESGDGIEFELRNDGADSVGLNPYEWRIERRTDEGWDHVAPEMYIEPWTTLRSGERVTWLLGDATETASESLETIRIEESLDAGVYAFGVHGFVTGGKYEGVAPQTNTDDESGVRVEWVVVFEVTE